MREDIGSGSVHQLESGYDWTRTQTNLKKRLDNVDKIWDNINVRVREEKFPCVNEDTEDTLSKSDAEWQMRGVALSGETDQHAWF